MVNDAPTDPPISRCPLRRRGLVLLLLAVSSVSVYRGALDRVFLGDQIRYFTELGNDPDPKAGFRFWDQTAARRYWKGDELLFRPGVGVFLAVENLLFGYNFRCWNVVNLALHIAVSFLLFELLWTLQPTVFAAAFALIFSVLAANFELVAWNHLGGYLLGFGLLLLALRAAVPLARGEGTNRRRLQILYAIAALGACCCHEAAAIGAALTAVYVTWSERRRGLSWSASSAAAVLAPLLTYGALYVGHVARCERWLWRDMGTATLTPAPLRILQCLGDWTWRALNPVYSELLLKGCYRSEWARKPGVGLFEGASIITAVAWVALVGIGRAGFTRDRARALGPLAAVAAATALSYAVLVGFGRSAPTVIPYYVYFFALLGGVAAFALIDFSRLGPRARGLSLALLAAIAAANAAQTARTSGRLKELNAPLADYFDAVEAFVATHRGEPGFAFAARGPAAAERVLAVWKGYPEGPPQGGATPTLLLYPRYYDPSLLQPGSVAAPPKYVLEWRPEPPKPATPEPRTR